MYNKNSNKIPLIILHGGPGLPHEYLLTLSKLKTDRPILFYDQLGCGKSDRSPDSSLWTKERFIEELKEVLEYFKFNNVHILGHSWGGMLALEYYFKYQTSVKSLILASTIIDINLWIHDWKIYRKLLPKRIQEVLDLNEENETTDTDEYKNAVAEFYYRNVCRIHHWPKNLVDAGNSMGVETYHTMWGINEFNVTGNLKTYNVIDKLIDIKIPTILTSGEFDGSSPKANKYYESLIKNSKYYKFDNSAHMPHLEETTKYIETINTFLNDKL